MKTRLGPVTVELVTADITRQPDMEAVVNTANAALQPGGGVAGAIHAAAGPGLAEACRPLAPIRCGEAVITAGFNLPNRYVIHCLGPVYGRDEPSAALLAKCYVNVLRRAEAHRVASIALPAVSTGVFGYPMDAAAEVTLGAIAGYVEPLKSVRDLRFCLFDAQALHAFERAAAGHAS
jgi:O-acetyl-ADP-ribose deacetylase (regulator of RNase III)